MELKLITAKKVAEMLGFKTPQNMNKNPIFKSLTNYSPSKSIGLYNESKVLTKKQAILDAEPKFDKEAHMRKMWASRDEKLKSGEITRKGRGPQKAPTNKEARLAEENRLLREQVDLLKQVVQIKGVFKK